MYIRKQVMQLKVSQVHLLTWVCVCLFVCVGFQGQDFDWADYLKQCEAEAAPQQCFPPVSFLFCIFAAKALQKYMKHITNALKMQILHKLYTSYC